MCISLHIQETGTYGGKNGLGKSEQAGLNVSLNVGLFSRLS